MSLFTTFLAIAAGLTLFLIGFKHLASSSQHITGRLVRQLLNQIGEKSYLSSFWGALIGFLIQSETSLVFSGLSLTGSGLLGFRQVSLLMAGAFVSTVPVIWLFVVNSFFVAVYLLAVGGLISWVSRGRVLKAFGHLVASLGLLLIAFEIAGSFAPSHFTLNDMIALSGFVPGLQLVFSTSLIFFLGGLGVYLSSARLRLPL